MNVLWDYRTGGFYVSERYAPLRYRARRFLEKRAVPVLRKAGLALGAAAVAVFFALLALLERAGEAAEEALVVLAFLPYREITRRIAWWTTAWVRRPWEIPFALVILLLALGVFGGMAAASFLTVGFFLLAGNAAGKLKIYLKGGIQNGYR